MDGSVVYKELPGLIMNEFEDHPRPGCFDNEVFDNAQIRAIAICDLARNQKNL